MEEMIDAYLAFAAGEGEEQPQKQMWRVYLNGLWKRPKKHINLISAFLPITAQPPVFPVEKRNTARLFKRHLKCIRYSTKLLCHLRSIMTK